MRDRSRCFAFVDFHPEEARNFIHSTQNEIKIRGFRVSFDYADPKDEAIISERSRSTDPRFSGNVEEPTSNIMVRGIPADVDEREIMEELNRNNVNFADVRVIRDRQTGVSRGFGFIEFASTQEAIHWMDAQNGVLHVRRHVMRLNFSSPRNQNDSSSRNDSGRRDVRGNNSLSALASGDWQCLRCSSHNFKRRDVCFRCQNPRPTARQSTCIYNSDGSELIGTTPCNTLILRCLDAYTTEASIQAAFSDQHNLQVKRCFIVRDGSNNSSRFAVAELPTVADAYNVIDTIIKEHKIFEIEGKAIAVGYAKNNFNTIMATLKSEGAIIEPAAPNNVAVRSAAPTSSTAYAGAYPTSQIPVPAGVYPNSGVAVAQAAIELKQAQARLTSIVAQSVHNPQGILGLPPQQGGQSQSYGNSLSTFPPPTMPFNATTAAVTEYPVPDTTKFLFDETIRYYYDPVTGLLYEPNTRYFFDRITQQYFHYDATRSLYIPASQVANQQQQPELATETVKATGELSKKKDKKEKEKNAQKIAKEMEKWAKRMNSQKEAPPSVPKVEQQQQIQTESSKTADMGYAVLQASTSASASNNSPSTAGLVAQYGGDDSDEEEVPQTDEKDLEAQVSAEETKLIDWTKLACLLCARGFKDADTLQKHRVFSNLHLQSLNKLRAKYGLKELTTLPLHQQPQPQKQESKGFAETIESLRQLGAAVASNHAREVAANRQQSISASPPIGAPYRDRAKERREKFGTVPPPQRNFDRSADLSTMPTPPHSNSMEYPPLDFSQPPPHFNTGVSGGADVGSRLMAKMGWQAGQGLGKANQGRTQLVEAEFREAGVGLGVKASKRLPPSDNYKDNVKRAMYARYHELG
nr:RNA binding protein 5 [Hymenolepis microstoma]